ncbi:uncharacterized protein LOC133171613 [Saccostrea echinata]|uniref:uncharacterized protein LOC133171613 n=1 Tax=Saccostrea echinata TaxID=191078 RepID=UPI002A835089|nr:uncharacterized protein LOC133171613 [Saccostrea echinata]
MGDEGKQMSLYGKSYLSPEEMAGLWKNVLQRTETIRLNHLANKGDGSKHWSGVKQWSRHELETLKDTFFGKRTRGTVADSFSTYDRLFHPREEYDSKIHRDDRNHILKIGIAVHDEEKNRVWPVLSSSAYGRRLDCCLEPFCRSHVRIEHVAQGFSYTRGTGLPPN